MHCWRRIFVATTCLLVLGAGCKNSKSKNSESAKAESPSKDDQNKSDKDKTKTTSKTNSDKSGEDLPFEATGPVAKVNGTEISAEAYNDIVRKVAGRMRRGMPKRMVDKFKSRAIKQAVDKHLIDKEIEKEGIEVTDKEVEKEFQQFKEQFPEDRSIDSFLKMRNTDKKELKKNMRDKIALEKLLKKRKGVEITEEDLKNYYDNNASEFEQKEQVKASHILLKAKKDAKDKELKKAKKKAGKLAKKAKKSGTDFAKLARENSEGPTSKKGGDLGYFTRDKMVSKFSDKAFSMENGEIAGPVKTRFGFHIIKRTGHKEAGKKSFDEAKTEIRAKLEKRKIGKAVKKFTKELRKEADVKEMPDNIKVNVEPSQGRGGGLGAMGGGGGSKKMQLKKLKQKLKKRQQQKQQQQQSGQGGGGQ